MKVSEMKINNCEVLECKINNLIVYRKQQGQALILKVIYAKSNISNSVTVTLISSNKISEIGPGAWLKVDDYTYKKVYQNTQYQTATVVDEFGNKESILVDCRKQENDLEVALEYLYQEDKARVRVFLTANKAIKQIAGWQVQNEFQQVMYYYRNQSRNITVEDLEGNTLLVEIVINQFEG